MADQRHAHGIQQHHAARGGAARGRRAQRVDLQAAEIMRGARFMQRQRARPRLPHLGQRCGRARRQQQRGPTDAQRGSVKKTAARKTATATSAPRKTPAGKVVAGKRAPVKRVVPGPGA